MLSPLADVLLYSLYYLPIPSQRRIFMQSLGKMGLLSYKSTQQSIGR